MNSFFTNTLNQLREFFAKLSRKDKIRLAVLTILIIVFSITLALILGRVKYATLYSGLSNAENGSVVEALKEMGVANYKVQGDSILVPADQADELRMSLEATGIQGGDLPTNFIDRALGFSVTTEDRQTYTTLQTQSYLRTTIMHMEKIDNCYVLLTMPQDSLFAKSETRPASASVMLELKEGATLSSAEALSIGTYVMGAVPGLLPENIRIVDSQMNLYPLNQEEDKGGTGSEALDYQYALRERVKNDLETQVTNFLQPVFGPGHVRASVNVVLNFDKQTISSVDFEPPVEGAEEGLVISMQELYESSRYASEAEGVPGTDTNGVGELGTPEYPYLPLNEDELYRKALREINYELDETRTEIEKAQGTIRDLSIGVMLDSNYIEEDYSDSVRDLVAQAIGVNTRYISVARLPFQIADTTDLQAQNDLIKAMENRKWIPVIIIAVSVLLLVFLILSFISTILRTFSPPQPALAIAEAGGSVDYLATEAGIFLSDGTQADEIPISTKPEEVEQLEHFIERDPQAVAQLLRNWLSDDYR